MERVNIFFKDECCKCLKTWSKISEDTEHKESMIDSSEKAYDFDKGIVKKIGTGIPPKAADGVFIKKNKLLFIEFKNTNSLKLEEIRLKAYESILELSKIFKEQHINCSFEEILKLSPIFILVYNDKKFYGGTDITHKELLEKKQRYKNLETFLKKYEGILYEKTYILKPEEFSEFILGV